MLDIVCLPQYIAYFKLEGKIDYEYLNNVIPPIKLAPGLCVWQYTVAFPRELKGLNTALQNFSFDLWNQLYCIAKTRHFALRVFKTDPWLWYHFKQHHSVKQVTSLLPTFSSHITTCWELSAAHTLVYTTETSTCCFSQIITRLEINISAKIITVEF